MKPLLTLKNRLRTSYSAHLVRYVARNSWQELRARIGIKHAAGGAYTTLASPSLAAERALRIAREFHERLRTIQSGAIGSVIEIGPGDSLATLALWIGFGAQTAVGIDSYADPRCLRRERDLFRCLVDLVSPEERQRILTVANLDGPELELDEKRIRYIGNCPVEHLDRRIPAGQADLIISNAVLEHVQGVPQALQAMHLALAPGGVMLHKVDLRNHGVLAQFGDTAYLKPPEFLWKMMGSANGSFPNRKDISVYEQALSAAGAKCQIELTWKDASGNGQPGSTPQARKPDGFWLSHRKGQIANPTNTPDD